MSYLFEGKQRFLNDFYYSEGHENNNDDDDVDENIEIAHTAVIKYNEHTVNKYIAVQC